MLPSYLNLLAPIFTLLASFFYIKSVFKKETIPNKVGWFIWMLAPLVSSFIILKNGGGLSAIPVFMSWIIPLVVLVASYNIKSEIKVTKLDLFCLVSALVAIYFWLIAKDIYMATVFAIIADGLGFIPTIVKSWKYKNTEKPWPYMSGILSASISLLTLKEYAFHLWGFPFYLIIGNAILISVIYIRNRK
ncbi:MAG: hypothetical protein ACK4FA_01825 [Candidatus Paceibacteria bacterium]